jgi:hypothetical protein
MRGAFPPIIIVFTLVCAVLYIIKTSREDKKKFTVLGCGILIYVLYCTVVSITTLFSGVGYVNLVLHMGMLFLLCHFKDRIDFKTLTYLFIAGIFTASFIGLFVDVITNIGYRVYEYREYGLVRFSGLTGNPNRLHAHLFVALNALFVLDFRKQISWKAFYPLVAVLLALGISTISRTFIIIILVNIVLWVGLKLWRERLSALKTIALVGMVVLAVCAIMYPFTLANLMRMNVIPEREIVERSYDDKMRQYTDLGVHPSHSLWYHEGSDVVDPGDRSVIWERNIEEWLKNPRTILFGNGLNSDNFGLPHTHNLYIHLLVKTGVIGVLLFALFWASLFYNLLKTKKYKFDIVTLLLLAVFAAHSILELRFPAITSFLFFLMFVFSLEKNQQPLPEPTE